MAEHEQNGVTIPRTEAMTFPVKSDFPSSALRVFSGEKKVRMNPTMKMINHKGGHSIAVYDPSVEKRTLDKIHRLISDGRVNFIAPADYTENSQIDIAVRGIIGRMARRYEEQE